jgi:hypothetical protein
MLKRQHLTGVLVLLSLVAGTAMASAQTPAYQYPYSPYAYQYPYGPYYAAPPAAGYYAAPFAGYGYYDPWTWNTGNGYH